MTTELAAALQPVADLLDRLGVCWHVGGSVASSSFGKLRTTQDVDIVADLRPEHVAPLCRALDGRYYADEEMARAAIERRSCFNMIHLATMYKVDVFVPGDSDYDRAALERSVIGTLPGMARVPLATAEDMVLRKLAWYRTGGEVSERQWDDVLGVLKVQHGRLDLAYLQRWAPGLGVADLLARAVADASA